MSEIERAMFDSMVVMAETEVNRLHYELSKVTAERDRLREALKEALEELDSLVQRETMSQSKWSQHTVWMEWLRSALEEKIDGT